MWQRIQTVWLILSVLFMALFLCLPYGVVSSEAGIFELTAWGVRDLSGAGFRPDYIVGGLSALVGILALVGIFLFRKRSLQARVVRVALILLILTLLTLGYLAYGDTKELAGDFSVRFGLALPIATIPLLLMALRGIFFDEALVRSANRLR